MDNLVDTVIVDGMQRSQIQLRLYLTVRRQVLTLLCSIEKDMNE